MTDFFETKKGGLLVLAIIAIVFFFPLLNNADYWGGRDWGFHLFMNGVEKKTMEDYHQFPFWNPYRCGGNIDFGHPENPILSLHFILVSIRDVMTAIKIDILLYVIIGLFGMFMLSRHFKLEKYSSYLPPLLYILNSALILTLAEGNYWYRAIVWVPWLAYFYLKCEDSIKYVFPAAFFMLMIFFDTDSYAFGVMIFFMVAYGVMHLLLKKKWNMLAIAFVILAVTGMVGAVKFLPMVEFTSQYPQDRIDNNSGYNFQTLWAGLESRDQGPYSQWFMPDQHPFFAYGMYIGILPLILGIVGILLYYRKYLPLALTMVIALVVAFGKNSMINLYALIKAIPLYDYFHEATRFNLVFLLAFSIFAGLALSRLESLKSIKLNTTVISKKTIQGIVLVILAVVVIDLFVVTTPVLTKIFIAPPLVVRNESPSFMQVYSPYGSNPWTDGKVSQDLYYNVWGHAMYLNMEANLGTRDGNCHGTVNMSAQAVNLANGTLNPLYRGEIYLLNGGTVNSWKFTPNVVTASVTASAADVLVLNQNYYTSWRAKGAVGQAFNYNGLVAVNVDSSTKEVEFYHSPKSFWVGLVVSVIALIASILVYIKFDKLKGKFKWLKFDF